jgi:hypothetical protein
MPGLENIILSYDSDHNSLYKEFRCSLILDAQCAGNSLSYSSIALKINIAHLTVNSYRYCTYISVHLSK